MRQVTTKGLITMAAAGGVLALSGGAAYADSDADGNASNSPGVLSGNSVQVPVHVPVNACGNTVNVVGVLNPAMGNACANKSGSATPGKSGQSGQTGQSGQSGQTGTNTGTHTGGGATAQGDTNSSPGVGSGNNVKVPVHVPVNACGNGVSVIALLNPAFGNDCSNESGPVTPDKPQIPETPHEPQTPVTPDEPGVPGTPDQPGTPPTPAIPNTPQTQTVTQPQGTEMLAQTGSSGSLGIVIPAGAGLLLAGAVLYRRARSAA